MPAKLGLWGSIERFLTTRYLRSLFIQELELLAKYATGDEKPGQ